LLLLRGPFLPSLSIFFFSFFIKPSIFLLILNVLNIWFYLVAVQFTIPNVWNRTYSRKKKKKKFYIMLAGHAWAHRNVHMWALHQWNFNLRIYCIRFTDIWFSVSSISFDPHLFMCVRSIPYIYKLVLD
jgi:hypothetical protein